MRISQATRLIRIPTLRGNIQVLEQRIEEIKGEIARLAEGCEHTRSDGAPYIKVSSDTQQIGSCHLCGRPLDAFTGKEIR